MTQNTKQLKKIIGFLQFLRVFIPKLQQHLLPSYKLLKNNPQIIIRLENHECLNSFEKSLIDASAMSERFPLKDKQFVIMTNASMHSAGHVFCIEYYTQKEGIDEKRRHYAPAIFESHWFNAARLKSNLYCNEFLAVYYAFEIFCHLIWDCS